MRDDVYPGISHQEAKNRTIEGKQALTKGLSIGEIKQIANSVENTLGLSEAIQHARNLNIWNVGFSDGLGPFVAYKMTQQNVEVGGIVPAALEDGRWLNLDNYVLGLNEDNSTLLGKAGSFRKAPAIFEYIERRGYPIQSVAAIDDSSANLETLKRIKERGGVALGFNVNDGKAFEKVGISVLKGDNIWPFAEILSDRRKIREYCETWGLGI